MKSNLMVNERPGNTYKIRDFSTFRDSIPVLSMLPYPHSLRTGDVHKAVQDILFNLNPAQREAVTTMNGPLLVIAGAGSGKTRVLVHRIAYLISQGVRPDHILAVTFTNKAAGEMKNRVEKLLSSFKFQVSSFMNSTPHVSTFHALGVYLLRRDGHHIGIPRSFTILDEDDAQSVVKHIIKERKLDPKQFQPARVRNIISRSEERR